MKAVVNTKRGTIEVEGDDQAELFKAMASAEEVFNETECGLCGCKNIRPVVRKNKDNEEFYEYQCQGFVKTKLGEDSAQQRCRAYLYLGQNKKGGGLFPVRQLDEKGKPDRTAGKFGKHNGWTRYRGEQKS